MGTLTRFFFRTPYSAPRTGEIIRWWESRRPAYNLALLAAGTITVGIVYLMELLTPGRARFPHPLIIVVYAVLANLFYTLGPLVDTLIMRMGGREYSEAGPMLFRYGFVFAILLTLLPIPVMALRILLGAIF
jgi:hypothetical protein